MRRAFGILTGDHWLVATIVVFLSASLASGWQTYQTISDLFQGYRTGTWMVVEAQAEFDKTRQAAARFLLAPGEEELAALRLQFDVYWSRIPLILNSAEADGIRKVPAVLSDAEHLMADLPALDADLSLIRPGDASSARQFTARLDTGARHHEEMTRVLLVQDELRYQSSGLAKGFWQTIAGFAAAVLAGLFLIAGNLSKNNRIRALFAQREVVEKIRATQLAAIESSGEGIATFDLKGRLQYANEAFHRIIEDDFTRTFNQVIWYRFLGSEGRRKVIAALRSTKGQGAWRGEVVGRTLAGSARDWDVHIISPDASSRTVLVRDLSDRKRAEQQREALVEQLHRMDKMDAVGRLAGGVAHDFNNILAAISGFGAMLDHDLRQQPEQHYMIRQILGASERGKELVQGIMAFSRAEKAERHLADLAAVCKEAAVMAGLSFQGPAVFQVDIEPKATPVYCNPTQINRVIVNLCINARDALPDGRGTVTLEARRVFLDGGRKAGMHGVASISAAETPTVFETLSAERTKMLIGVVENAPAQYLRLRIKDNGSGIPEPVMRRMFEPFYTTKALGEGTGLGLASVLGIIAAHGGAMAIDSTVNEGTTFDVLLPIVEGTATSTCHELDQPGEGLDLRVLVVDDDAGAGEALCLAMVQLGCDPVHCQTASEALSIVTDEACPTDVIVIDMMMPGHSGLELAQQLRESGCRKAIVLTSGRLQEAVSAERARLGIEFFIPKPFVLRDVAGVMTAVAAQIDSAKFAPGMTERPWHSAATMPRYPL